MGSTRRLRVLILEDRPADAELMIAELRRAGFPFDWHRVDSEREFISQLDAIPDLILADFHMPQFTGLRALQILKDRHLDIPFIIVSGSIGEETAVTALQEGATDYLLKDRLTRLGAAAARAMEAKQLRDKKQLAEEELAREHNLLRTLIDSLPDYINVKDLESRFVVVNEAYARFLGKQHPDELLGKTVSDVFPPHLLAQYVDDDQRVIRGGQLLDVESETVDREGKTRWHAVTKVPFRNGAGETVGLVGIARDITERRQAEEKIEKQLETLTALYAGAQKLTRSLQLDELAEDVVRVFVEVLGARHAWIGRAESDGTIRMLSTFPSQDSAFFPRGASIRWDDGTEAIGPAGRAIRSGFPVVDAADRAAPHWRQFFAAIGMPSMATLPLIIRDRPFGVVGVLSSDPDFFTPGRVEFFQAFANQAAAALENARLFQEAEERLQQLQALRNIDMAITASLDLRVTLNVILDQVTTHLKADAADVLLFNPHTQELRFAINRGFRSKALQASNLRLGEGHAGRAALDRCMLIVPNLTAEPGEFTRSAKFSEEGFVAYFAVPLEAKGQIKGVLEVFHRAPLLPTQEWLNFLEALAGQAAIAIDNSTLFDNLQRSNLDLVMAYDSTLEGWSKALDLRDKETEGHTLRVTDLTMRLSRMMRVGDAEQVDIRRGALLHDIGKMGIPDQILLKPGPLTDDEWKIMREHPVYAYQLLAGIPYLRRALDIPYCHHEKWDGTGYPRGLKGSEIPAAARIFAVMDVYDALTSDRPYRKAWPKEKALQYIREQSGKHFDPAVVEQFLEMEL